MSIINSINNVQYFSEYKRLRYCENCKEFNYHLFTVKFPKTLFKCDECNINSSKIGIE